MRAHSWDPHIIFNDVIPISRFFEDEESEGEGKWRNGPWPRVFFPSHTFDFSGAAYSIADFGQRLPGVHEYD